MEFRLPSVANDGVGPLRTAALVTPPFSLVCVLYCTSAESLECELADLSLKLYMRAPSGESMDGVRTIWLGLERE